MRFILLLLGFVALGFKSYSDAIIYDFENGNHDGITSWGSHLSVNEGVLQMQIDEANASWKAGLIVTINQDIFDKPQIVLNFKAGNIEADKLIGCAVTLKIDGIYTKTGDAGEWRLYPKLDASTTEWQSITIDLSPLVSSWEQNHGTDHGNIEEIKCTIGTNSSSGLDYSGELFFDDIILGDPYKDLLLIEKLRIPNGEDVEVTPSMNGSIYFTPWSKLPVNFSELNAMVEAGTGFSSEARAGEKVVFSTQELTPGGYNLSFVIDEKAVASELVVIAYPEGYVADLSKPNPNRGLYALWYQNSPIRDQILELPYIVGGQLVIQWGDIHTGPETFDFSILDNAMKDRLDEAHVFTIQFNGNYKPEWMFEQIPYLPEKVSVQVNNEQGSLMYWHPSFVQYHKDFLVAMADYIAQSPYRDLIIGIRLSPNAFGTEHIHLESKYIDLDQWTIPDGANPDIQVEPWSSAIAEEYMGNVVRDYVSLFSPFVPVFVRNNISSELEIELKDDFEDGRLSWFHTSSEPEPRGTNGSIKYGRFEDYCKTGKTLGFAEPWASAWGNHGGKIDDRNFSPAQWNYWRILVDLHCGISFIGLYASDLQVAIKGTYSGGKEPVPYDAFRQNEFQQTYEFASNYVGTHYDPATAPGAWVAFRANDMTIEVNGMTESQRTLTRLKSDYNFLMERMPDESIGLGVSNVGSDEQRYGAFARQLPSGKTMQLKADKAFLESLTEGSARIKVIYLDNEGAFNLNATGKNWVVSLANSGRWKSFEILVEGSALAADSSVNISAGSKDIHLHMLEIVAEREKTWEAPTDSANNTNPVYGIRIEDCPEGLLEADSTYSLSANLLPSNASDQTVIWSSSDTLVAKVDKNGFIKTQSGGNATITAISRDGGFSDECRITVNAASSPNKVTEVSDYFGAYPNPFGSYLEYRMKGSQKVQVELINSTGQVVSSSQISNSTLLKTDHLLPGLYTLTVNGKSMQKLMKQ